MSGRDSWSLHPQAYLGAVDSNRALAAQHTPRQNYLLAALPPDAYERVLPHLEPVLLPVGWTVHAAGDRERYLYFPTSGIVSRIYVTEAGASARLAVTGRDGVIGVASFLGGVSTTSQAVVLSAGYAYRLGAEVAKHEYAHDSPLLRLLLRYTLALVAQTAQIAVCNRHHTLEQQFCRWLLLCLDRAPGDEVPMTQELIGHMLGVRRESVTEVAGKLQRAGLIHYSRGHITVLDRPRVETHACECYAVVKREYDRLIPGFCLTHGASTHGDLSHPRLHASFHAPIDRSMRAVSHHLDAA
jgi:CRP-like cAMP-binding protein